jgi:uncharacterized protein YggU (UPF0235/DUF167 family)
LSACWRLQGDGLLLFIRLTPRAGAARLGGTWQDTGGQMWLCAAVTAPPDKGKANAALVRLLGDRLDIAASSISLEAGATSRLKRFHIDRADEAMVARIEALS